MPNVTQMIRPVTRQKIVRQDIVEKDYAISTLLAPTGENVTLPNLWN